MARPKTQEDVEVARINASLEKSALICQTIVNCLAILAFVGCFGILAWTVVTITDKPAWLEVALAILGLGGGTVVDRLVDLTSLPQACLAPTP